MNLKISKDVKYAAFAAVSFGLGCAVASSDLVRGRPNKWQPYEEVPIEALVDYPSVAIGKRIILNGTFGEKIAESTQGSDGYYSTSITYGLFEFSATSRDGINAKFPVISPYPDMPKKSDIQGTWATVELLEKTDGWLGLEVNAARALMKDPKAPFLLHAHGTE